jgi:glutamyl-Q tRNA(Asp) synthetase
VVGSGVHGPGPLVTQPVFRFAPSPNGRLHLGHAYSALLNASLAERWQGRFLLRIEDIDPTRSRPDFEAAIYEDLAWLGLTWEQPVRRQSEHIDDYRAAFRRLERLGLVYPCFCTRREIAVAVLHREEEMGRRGPRDPDGAPLYPGKCRLFTAVEIADRMAAGESPAWRIDSAKAILAAQRRMHVRCFDLSGAASTREARPECWGDAVLVRKDTPTSYHLSVVVDDALQGITHVVRGQDLEPATDLHVLLQSLLDLPSPAYHHHELILDEHGAKLAKSAGSEPLAAARARGVSPAEIRGRLGF